MVHDSSIRKPPNRDNVQSMHILCKATLWCVGCVPRRHVHVRCHSKQNTTNFPHYHDTMGASSTHADDHRTARIIPSQYTMTVLCLGHTPAHGCHEPLATHTPQHYQKHWVPTHTPGDDHTIQIQTHPTRTSTKPIKILD